MGWLSILLLGSIPFLLAFLSQGFASDEEVGRLQIARFAPETPDLFLSLRGRPLVTLLFAGPAQFGLLPVRLLSALASLLCGFVVFETLRRGGLGRWAALGPVFLFAQPLFLGYSYTAMTEPWGALLLALFLWTSVPSPNARLALVAMLLPLVRLEFVVLWPIVLWALLPNHRRSLLLVPLGLVVWMLLGVLATGDWGWFAAQAQWSEYKAPHTFHYFQGWSWGSGPLVVLLASLGLLFRPKTTTPRERSQRLWLNAAFMLLGLFLAYTAFATWRPTSGGNLRYLAFAAPALAVLSVFGARALWNHANRRGLLLGLLALFSLCLLVWSGVYRDDFRPSGKQTWLPALVALGLVLVWFFRSRLVFAAVILAAAVAHQAAYHPNKLPWKASSEHLAIRDLAEQAPQSFIANAHPYFAYETGTNPFRHQTSLVQHPQIPVGDYLLWETHYSARQVHDLSPQDLLEDPTWSFSQGKIAHDRSWAGAIFKRVVNNEKAGGLEDNDQIAWARE
ncbi:MAG: hypothetical protein HKN21_16050, partial [Candidatus Eisenbacteria bacterium]|nr:hypothetical protein [Candidatus Eisenbacteria bacterium]